MTFIIPMAGRGSRFINAGYTQPKYMIEVKGKTLFEYSLNSLPLDICDEIIFICLKEHKNFNVESFIYSKISHKNIKIHFLDKVTKGQAQTVYSIKGFIDDDEEIVIYNIDTYFESNKLRSLLLSKDKEDGILGAFIDESDDNKWSFASLDLKDNVIRTTEKEKISNYALTGLYHFSKSKDFFVTAKNWIENNITVRDEFYVAPMYNDLIKQDKKFIIDIVDKFIPLGTPQEVENFARTI